MALGRVREGDFRRGTPVTLPHNFGNAINLSEHPESDGDFANPEPSNLGNVNIVNWTPTPTHFGNQIGGMPVTPTFSPIAGTYPEPQRVLIISQGADAIYFTIDGSTPTIASPLYTGDVRVNVTTTLKAIAVINNVSSAVGTAAYVIGAVIPPPPPSAPTYVQSGIGFHYTLLTDSLTLGVPATAGDSMVVYVTAANGVTVSGVTDNAGTGNVYTLVRGPDADTNAPFYSPVNCYVFFCQNIAGTPTTISWSLSTDSSSYGFGIAVETTSAHIDASIFGLVSLDGVPNNSGGNIITTAASDLLLGFVEYLNGSGSKTFIAGTGWTLSAHYNDIVQLGTAAAFEQQTAGAAGSYAALITTSGVTGGGSMTTVALKS